MTCRVALRIMSFVLPLMQKNMGIERYLPPDKN